MNVHLIAITLWTMWSCPPTTKLRRLVKIILLLECLISMNGSPLLYRLLRYWILPDLINYACLIQWLWASFHRKSTETSSFGYTRSFRTKVQWCQINPYFSKLFALPFSEKVISKYPGKTTQTFSWEYIIFVVKSMLGKELAPKSCTPNIVIKNSVEYQI